MATKYERQHHFEKEWIGSVIKDSSLFDDKTVSEMHFHSPSNRALYHIIEKCIRDKKPLDDNTWRTLSQSELNRIGGMENIIECRSLCNKVNAENVKRIEAEMQTFTTAESIIQLVKDLPKKEVYDIEEVRTIANEIQNTFEGVSKKRTNITDLVMQTNLELMNVGNGLSGVDTGYKCLNDALDGFELGSLFTIGARPSTGKTAITVNIMLASAIKGNAITYIPAETGAKSIVKRAIAILGNLPVNAMKNPKAFLTDEQMTKYNKVLHHLSTLPIHIEELHDIGDIRQLVRERIKAEPDRKHCVIIDHLGHLSSKTVYQNRTQEFEGYCKELKAICRDFNVAIILLSQLSRSVETRQDKIPMMSDLRDSGGIEQISDQIAFLYREDYYKDESERAKEQIIKFIIAKNRDGNTGSIDLIFIPSTNRVVEEE